MKIEKYMPNALLQPFIQTFLIIESEDEMQNRILPSNSIVFSFRIRGTVTALEGPHENMLPISVIAGIRKSPRLFHYAKGAATLLVIFREGGAANFFKAPLQEIFGMSLSLDNLIAQAKIRELEEKILAAKTNRQRIYLVENFLLSEWQGQRLDPLILETIRKIQVAKGELRIHELLKEMPISIDAYEKKFRQIVGTTPKQFSQIIRIRNLIDGYSPKITLTEAAYQAGYFDQAHLIKDFKTFTGLTPKEFFKSASYW
ncbi:MAG: helix-turn-helix domain-containing protein [Chloroflexi bacterium]|nr:helix-turn-helix domain-containing protein [Chloroflexota bacterium]